MLPSGDVGSVAHAIQLSVAPVFVLTGIGALLTVMTNRLARVIDRARALEGKLATMSGDADAEIRAMLKTLAYRAKLIGRAIYLCTTTALLVCTVIALLFIGTFLGLDPAMPVALLFIAAMIALVAGLLWFLREIYVATSSLRIGPDNHT